MTPAAAKYEYDRRLGGGGMAEVFLARTVGAEGFQRPVAIKRVLPSFSHDPQFASMFVNEARLSALLRHPNVVQVVDFDRDAVGRLYLVMELVEGKDLSDVVGRGSLPIPVVVYVITEVLKGLAYAHDLTSPDGKPLGIVHRDISPHNVLVSYDGEVKVSDFGIAKAMLASGAARSGLIKGKPLYMAPEQVTAPDAVDHRADLFAVGVMMFELLTGQRIYQGTTNEEVLTDVIQVAKGWRQLTPATAFRPDLPADVSRVVTGLLAADRQHRFAHARDAIDALLATGSATPRGADLLADILAERFPGEAPPRRRRSAVAPAHGPQAPTMVTPAALSAPAVVPAPPAITPAGTPTAAGHHMPVPATAAMPPTGATSVAASRRRVWPFVFAVVALGIAAAAVAFVLVRSPRGATTPMDANPASAAESSVDAATAPVVGVTPDAAADSETGPAATATEPPGASIDAGVVSESPKAEHKKKSHSRKHGDGEGGSTIHEVKIEGK